MTVSEATLVGRHAMLVEGEAMFAVGDCISVEGGIIHVEEVAMLAEGETMLVDGEVMRGEAISMGLPLGGLSSAPGPSTGCTGSGIGASVESASTMCSSLFLIGPCVRVSRTGGLCCSTIWRFKSDCPLAVY